jgi:hypothetical protein
MQQSGCPITLVLGGPPCEDVAMVNADRTGVKGTRSVLLHYFFVVLDLLTILQPTVKVCCCGCMVSVVVCDCTKPTKQKAAWPALPCCQKVLSGYNEWCAVAEALQRAELLGPPWGLQHLDLVLQIQCRVWAEMGCCVE